LGQGLPQQLRLALTVIIEGNVGMPLDAGAGVPGGFAMSNGNDAGRNHDLSLSPPRYSQMSKKTKDLVGPGQNAPFLTQNSTTVLF
jgi:hypothetical protein